MDCILTSFELKAVAALGLLFIAASIWVPLGEATTASLPKGFKRAGMALQLSGNLAEVNTMLGLLESKTRAALSRSIYKDFVFIIIYAAFFISLALIGSQVNSAATRWLAILAVVCALAAATVDLMENFRMLNVLRTTPEKTTQNMIDGIRQMSLLKWGSLFATFAVLALIYLSHFNLISVIGVLLAIAAICGFAGLLDHRLIVPALLVIALVVATIFVLFIFFTDRSLRALCNA